MGRGVPPLKTTTADGQRGKAPCPRFPAQPTVLSSWSGRFQRRDLLGAGECRESACHALGPL